MKVKYKNLQKGDTLMAIPKMRGCSLTPTSLIEFKPLFIDKKIIVTKFIYLGDIKKSKEEELNLDSLFVFKIYRIILIEKTLL